jgi:phosphatidylinositol alpha-1,6-mannosyltransferase
MPETTTTESRVADPAPNRPAETAPSAAPGPARDRPAETASAGDARCLLIASIFPPIHGGSAVVYENLARFSDGEMVVLAPYRHYQTGHVLVGWLDRDKEAPYATYRVELLRPRQSEHRSRLHSLWSFAATDLPLKARVLWTVARIIRREGIRVMCIGELNSGSWLGPFLKAFFGTKVVNYIHGEEITTTTVYRFYGRNRRRHLQRADAVVAVSNFTKDALIEMMGVPPEKIEVIFNGVDIHRFTPRPKNRELIERYGLERKRILVSVGRLVERKGIDHVLKALPAVRKAHPDVHYVVVGDGPYRARLEEIAREEEVEAHVTFAGSVPSETLVDHYALADLFVMPNRQLADGDTEGFGLVFLEANACGKPVIGGRAGGAVEAIHDGVSGLLVDGWNVGEIAEAIGRVLGDEALYQRLQEGGLRLALDSGWDSRARQFQALCRRLVGA